MSKVILVIRDGWGYRKSSYKNAIKQTSTPNAEELMKNYPSAIIKASGEAVGLPDGYQGNSEVGHLTIGSGRIIPQSLTRINNSIKEGSFFENKAFLKAVNNCKKNNSSLHLMGLLQVEGVHAHKDHLFALLDLCKKEGLKDVYVHVFTDGRDSPPTDSPKHVKSLKKKIKKTGIGVIATISGRYYAMDRDKRWQRTKKAYDCIVKGEAKNVFKKPVKAIKESYKQGVTDEFLIPLKHEGYDGIKENDSIIFYNYRTDRPRQLTKAIVEDEFKHFKRDSPKVFFVAMTEYYKDNLRAAFKDIKVKNLLGEVIADKGLKQLRISETEKYAHVTFFFNGQVEKPYKNEDRILIPSPKVSTYDLKPEMSVYKITKRLVKEIKKDKYHLIVVNLVNGDMVGHTGVVKAIKKAVSDVDKCVGRIVKEGLANDYSLIIFADHGNAEDQREKWLTSHTINPVPCMLVSSKFKNYKLQSNSGLKDVAPTTLDLMGIKKPEEMTGKSMIIRGGGN
ncbi:2,3-bisphosphoglycerate-independent phosphoglycerate mutase [archaeon]|nr:2,3-bisphosphoglycerate-independent phosphoglycerate mutase [archaeon]